MGIKGLSTFFSEKTLYFKDVSLSDTEVIIDGSNLYYLLVRSCKGANLAFGGDYDKLERHFKNYFTTFLKCNVTPIVIFDGGIDDIKMKTCLKSAQNLLQLSLNCNPTNQTKKMAMPCLSKDLMLSVLRELKIETLQTEYEADQAIALLGMKKKCPVLSNDSDFFVFSVDFVKLDSVDIISSQEEGRLICSLFDRDKFLERNKINSIEFLHLFATLNGNDYVPSQVFDLLLSKIKKPAKKKNVNERQRRISALITLFSDKKWDVSTAINQLLGRFCSIPERDALREKIFNSMAMYSDKGAKDFVITEPESLSKEVAPLYLKCRLNRYAMDVVNRKWMLLKNFLVECFYLPSCHTPSLPILRTILSLILPEKDNIRIQGRVKSRCLLMESLEVEPLNLSELSKTDRLNLIMRTLEWDPESDQLPAALNFDLVGLFLIVRYWCLHDKVTEHKILALITFRLLSMFVDPKLNYRIGFSRLEKEVLSDKTEGKEAEYVTCMKRYISMYSIEESLKCSSKNFDKELVHSFNILQSIYYHVSQLNSLLGDVLVLPKIAHFYNGAFIYNLTVHLSKQNGGKFHDGGFLPEFLQQEFSKLKNIFLSTLSLKSPQTKRKKKKGGKNKCVEDLSISSEDHFADMLDSSDSEDSAFYDIENKFSLLMKH